MHKAKVTSKGQVTIPKEVREKLRIKPGDVLEIRETESGYSFQKYIDPKVLDKYVGYLKTGNTTTTDQLIEELRAPSKSLELDYSGKSTIFKENQ